MSNGKSMPAAQPNLIDKAIGYFSPERGADRLASRVKMSMFGGYQGGMRDRRSMRNWRPWARSANEDTLPDLRDLRARSRDLARNSPLAGGALSTVVTNVVGDGLTCSRRSTIGRCGMTPEAARDGSSRRRASLRCGRGIRISPIV
jgi:capsid protein